MLDPLHWVILETNWCALEDAGIDPERLKGTWTGVCTDEFRMLVLNSACPAEVAGCLYVPSSTNMNGSAGRVSIVMGLMGPARATDATCARACRCR